MNRAYSVLTIKSIEPEQRIIRGVATTPTVDRVGDVIDPMGVRFAESMPLLWQHKSDKPVGRAKFGTPTEKGIPFEAYIEKTDEPGTLKDRLDEAWQSVKMGLVGAVSIGFKVAKGGWEWLKETDGMLFTDITVLELSLVTIPANSEALINDIKFLKSLDAPLLAASGLEAKDIDRPKRPGVTGITPLKEGPRKGGINPPPKDFVRPDPPPPFQPSKAPKDARKMPKTIGEQIGAFEATRQAKAARMNELMTKAADENVTLDTADSEEYDTLEGEVKKVDEHLKRLDVLQKQNIAMAKPIEQKPDQHSVTLPGNGRVISVRSNAPPTAPFIRLCLAMMAGKGSREEAHQYAKHRVDWQSSTPEVVSVLENDDIMYRLRSGGLPYYQKAGVPAGSATDSVWAGPLVYAENMISAFAEYLRPLTIIGRFNTLRRVPFNIRVPRATAGTTGNWVGEAAPKPLTSMALDSITLTWAKAAAIVVMSEELVRLSNPAAEDMVRNDLARSITQFLDRQFVDPAVAAVTGVSPASITNGITPITATGVTMAAFRADVRSLFQSLLLVNQSLAGGYWIMTQQLALALSLAQNALGQIIYPTISAEGGTLLGYPVIAAENLPATGGSPADGYPLIFAIGPEILLADDGVVTIDASREASVQMDSAPDSPPTSSTNMLSLWQLNLLGLRAERWVTWVRRRTSAVAWIQNAKYAE